MLSMQDFHEWLLSAEEKADAYQHNLAQVTRASLTEILNIKNDDLTWSIWNTNKPEAVG